MLRRLVKNLDSPLLMYFPKISDLPLEFGIEIPSQSVLNFVYMYNKRISNGDIDVLQQH